MQSFLARHQRWIVAALVCFWTALFIGTHIPTIPQQLDVVSDKQLHTAAFAGLSFLVALASAARGHFSLYRVPVLFLVIVIYAAVDELLQIPVHRHADVRDWMADTLGTVIGFTSFAMLRLLAEKLSASPEPPVM